MDEKDEDEDEEEDDVGNDVETIDDGIGNRNVVVKDVDDNSGGEEEGDDDGDSVNNRP